MEIQSACSCHNPDQSAIDTCSIGQKAKTVLLDDKACHKLAETMDESAPANDDRQVPLPESMDSFLESVERKAFVIARYSLRNDDDALDAVQDAMLKLCEKYADKPANEWNALFFRILHNALMDRHRPRGMNRLKRWIAAPGRSSGTEETIDGSADAMDNLPGQMAGPQDELLRTQQSGHLNAAVSQLPEQQRQVFLLRCWQELSVRETASALNISEGSVKTHLSRAVSALRKRLQETSA